MEPLVDGRCKLMPYGAYTVFVVASDVYFILLWYFVLRKDGVICVSTSVLFLNYIKIY